MKKLNAFLNIMMGSFFGVFIGSTAANYLEYRRIPEIYEIRPSPWYCYGALSAFLLFLAVVFICLIIKFIIRKKNKNE